MRSNTLARRTGLAGATVAIALISLGAAAWACVPQGRVTLSPTSGPVGTAVTVSATNFTADATYKVWWGGVGKQLMASGTVGSDRTFKASFKVPSSDGGQKVVSASQYDAEGTAIGSPANATFKVDGASQPASSNQQGQPSDADGADGLESSASSSEQQSEPAPATASPAPAPTRTATPARTAQPARATAAAAPSAAPAASAAPAPSPATAEETAAPSAAPASPATPAPIAEADKSETFAAPAADAGEGETDRRSAPVLALAALGLLSLAFFSIGTAIFLNERRRVRAEA